MDNIALARECGATITPECVGTIEEQTICFHNEAELAAFVARIRSDERKAIMELAAKGTATFPSDSDYTRGYACAKQAFCAAIRAQEPQP